MLRACRLSQSDAHHLVQNGLYLAQRRGAAYLFLYHLHGEFLNDLPLFLHTLHEARAHHNTAVGNGVVERHYGDRRHVRLVADTHPRQCRVAPVCPLSVLVLLWRSDARCHIALQRQLEVLGDADAVQSRDELLRVVVVVFVYEVADTDVGADLQHLWHGDDSITTAMPVVVAHLCTVHVADAASRVHRRCGVYDAVLQCHHEAGGLEYRSRLEPVGDGVVGSLVVFARLAVEVQVHHRLDVARGHLHDDGDARVSVVLV